MDSGKKTTEVSALVTLCHKYTQWDLPGGPGVKTPCFHCKGHRFSPGGGTKIYHMPRGMAKKKKKKNVYYKHDITVDVDLDHLQRSCLPALQSHYLPRHSVRLPYSALQKEVTMHHPHLRSRELKSTSSRAEDLCQLFEIPLQRFVSSSPFIYIFNHSFISMDLWIFILYSGL